MKKLLLWLDKTSQPLIYNDIKNCYEKGSFYCILDNTNIVHKYPINKIWRIIETYS